MPIAFLISFWVSGEFKSNAEASAAGSTIKLDGHLEFSAALNIGFSLPSFAIVEAFKAFNDVIDVRGWTVLSRQMEMDRRRYGQTDNLQATVEFVNENGAAINGLLLQAALIPPDDGRGN